MEDKEIMTEEINENEEIEVYDEPEESGSGVFKKLAIGASILGGIGLTIALVYKKNRATLEERRIRKLEKKGYIIQRPIDIDTYVEDENVVEEVE